MNADKTVYGRYGTRSSVEEATKDMSLPGLAESMSAALPIHKGYPDNRASLAGKQAVPTEYKTPDEYPSLRGKFDESLDYDGPVTKSCMHCHQVRDAERQVYRDHGRPIPENILFPNPLPAVIGLTFDPTKRATVASVSADSIAEAAGLREGDQVLTLDGEPMISLADIQWVLHNSNSTDTLDVRVSRDGEKLAIELTLDNGWRRQSDISWRVSSWPLRRMGTGGLVFTVATKTQRRKAGVEDNSLALVVKHVGQYGPHATAKRAGFKEGDIMVSFNGEVDNMSTSQLLAYAVRNTRPGEKVPVEVVRNGNRKTLQLPMQR